MQLVAVQRQHIVELGLDPVSAGAVRFNALGKMFELASASLARANVCLNLMVSERTTSRNARGGDPFRWKRRLRIRKPIALARLPSEIAGERHWHGHSRFRGLGLARRHGVINGNLHTFWAASISPDIWFCQLC